MHKQIWLVLGFLSCLFASSFAMADEDKWWVVVVHSEPTLCGQTSEGQLLCLHADGHSPRVPTPYKKVGTLAQDWSFLESGPGPL